MSNKINIKKTEVLSNIFLLEFDNNIELGSTMLRFQEFYESPKFRGKFFTFEEYKGWYTGYDKKKKFTYYTDWTGFNIPSYVLKPFLKGSFDPLSDNEKLLLNLFKNKNVDDEFYIIAVSKESEFLVDHEIAHALYYTNKNYKKDVDKILSNYDVEKIKDELRGTGGYCEEVLHDEVHAWSLDKNIELKTPVSKNMIIELRKVFEKYKNKKN